MSERATARRVLGGYDRFSLVALALLVASGSLVGYRWSDLLDANKQLDGLLLGIWLWLAAMIAYRVSARRDLVLVVVGLAGGGVIEWWGTNTQLWRYFTDERPPLWILPAWPIAALAVERMAYLSDRCSRLERWSPRALGIAYWVAVPLFIASMVQFMRPALGHLASQVVVVLMLGVLLSGNDRRRDVALFVGGSVLGIFLEYWGTSRQCWTYYTEQVPPPVAVVAHGFAALAFQRAAHWVEAALGWARQRLGAARRGELA